MFAPRRTAWASFLVFVVALAGAASAQDSRSPEPDGTPDRTLAETPPPPTRGAGRLDPETEKLLYAIGVIVGRRLEEFQFTDAEYAIVEQGLRDVATGRELFVNENAQRKRITEFMDERRALRLELHKRASRRFLERAAEEDGAVETATGAIVTELRPGTGASPSASDAVRVHYHGRVYDGTVFDSSVERGEPELKNLARAQPCWREGLQRMREGGKSRIVCPASLAFGDRGANAVPGGAAIILEVELLEVVR